MVPAFRVVVRRDNIFATAFDGLNRLGPDLRRRVVVEFVNEQA
jgi:hypothetical protein